MKYGSLFSGAGGFELGLNALGWDCQWMCEVDPYPQQVLKYHWPDIPLYNDVTLMKGFAIEPVDVIVGGFPCQDLSVAGLKGGLEGTRSGLFYEFVRIVNEMRKITNGLYPRAVIWENVPGLISKTKDWISDIYTAWGESGALVQEHRLIDAKYFGVPQRRRRIVGVVVFDSGVDPEREILFDSEVLSGDFGSSGTQGQESSPDLERSIADGGELPTVINSWYKGPGNTQVETGCIIPFDTTQITNPDNRANPQPGVECHTLSASAKPPAIAFHMKQDPINGDVSPALGVSTDGMGVLTFVEQENISSLTANGIGIGGPDVADAQAGHLVAFAPEQSGALIAHDAKQISEPEYKLVSYDYGVRRLTPEECEALMGWPREWTLHGYNGKNLSDTRRYRMCGNGLVAPVATWAGSRLEKALCNTM